jgi:hypothetical protein
VFTYYTTAAQMSLALRIFYDFINYKSPKSLPTFNEMFFNKKRKRRILDYLP